MYSILKNLTRVVVLVGCRVVNIEGSFLEGGTLAICGKVVIEYKYRRVVIQSPLFDLQHNGCRFIVSNDVI